jgi:hypothetical protein
MSKQAKKKTSDWVLVDAEKLPVEPEIQQARDVWEGKQVWFLTPWQQWRRGKVQHVYNTGLIRVIVYQKGSYGLSFAFDLKHIPLLLKLVSR